MEKITDKDIDYLWNVVLGKHKSPERDFKDLPPKQLLRTFIVAWELGKEPQPAPTYLCQECRDQWIIGNVMKGRRS